MPYSDLRNKFPPPPPPGVPAKGQPGLSVRAPGPGPLPATLRFPPPPRLLYPSPFPPLSPEPLAPHPPRPPPAGPRVQPPEPPAGVRPAEAPVGEGGAGAPVVQGGAAAQRQGAHPDAPEEGQGHVRARAGPAQGARRLSFCAWVGGAAALCAPGRGVLFRADSESERGSCVRPSVRRSSPRTRSTASLWLRPPASGDRKRNVPAPGRFTFFSFTGLGSIFLRKNMNIFVCAGIRHQGRMSRPPCPWRPSGIRFFRTRGGWSVSR